MSHGCSIIIRTFNEARYLGELLDAIAKQTWPPNRREVVLVDSGSTDGTVEIAARHGCRIVGIRREEFSFGRSLNIGCEAARGETLVFISGHCVPSTPRWLEELVKPFEDARVAVTYGRQIGGRETKFSEHVLFEKYFPAHRPSGQAPFFCNNANAAVRRSEWAAHRFDESLTGLEDMHLAQRLVERGLLVRYVPKAGVLHHHHERWSQVRRRYEREAIALHRIMPEVHVHWHDALRYFAAGVLGDAALALSRRQLFRKLPEIAAFRACQYYGAWRGNHAHRELSRRQKERYFFPK
ncbi:MAG: glycosyltransferase family 2 protein [Terrimicrobiaceae bacterium]|nr:glycosyltransferase family 2 protein [Terrimicrobiaceae bacterium]